MSLLIRFKYQLLILIICLSVVWPLLLSGYFSHHDDLHVMRIYEMRRCFEDFQIPCRWVPDMGYGNGFPLFNYYGVLPYYIGAVLSYFLGFIGSAKVLFFIPLFFGGITMYFLGKELFGQTGGFSAAILYALSPYRALDSYVRGAIDESFGLLFIPLVFYFSLRLIKKKNEYDFILFTVVLALFLLSHNIMTLLFGPFIIVWILFWLAQQKFKNVLKVSSSFLLGVGLAAFFILPAFLEKNLVQTNTLTEGGLNFRAHFATISQLFYDRSWGYGASVFGPGDTMSFQIGWPHWWIALLAVLASLVFYLKKRFDYLKLCVLLFICFSFSIFMTHNRSIFVWDSIEIIQFTQFPWRFLGLTIFFGSLLGGLFIYLFPRRISIIGTLVILVLTVYFNWNFFKPEYFYHDMTDQKKLSGELWKIQQQAGILDYLPVTAQEPKGPRPELPEVISGEAIVKNFDVRSNRWSFDAKVTKDANLEVPVFDFPNWKTFVNGKIFEHNHDNRLGRIRLDLGPGDYKIYGVFYNTLVRDVANITTLVSLVIVIVMLWRLRPSIKK